MPDVAQLAALAGVAQSELLALSPANDPFALHRPARRADAEWFGTIWRKFNLGLGVHIRRVHYILVSTTAPILMPGGEPYLNTEKSWKTLVNASRDARYLGLVPIGAFVDRRNPDPIEMFTAQVAGEIEVDDGSLQSLTWLPSDFPELPSLSLSEAQYGPPVLVEVWAEKTTMNDVLVPLVRRYDANLVTGAGEMSLTSVYNLLERTRAAGVPVRILFISDFDPAGRSMPVAVARKIEYALDGATDLDIKLNPIVLTPAQCRDYELPRTPIKESERRGARFESRFGDGATELDALEALHPGALARIVGAEIERYIDPDAKRDFDFAAGEYREYLQQRSEEVEESFTDEIDLLRAEYVAITQRLDAWRERAAPVFAAVRDALYDDEYEIEPFEPPAVKEPDDPPNPLFDSGRDYLTQIDAYRGWQFAEEDEE